MDQPDLRLAALQSRLRREVDAEVRFDPGSRRLYATDASNYRVLPAGVVRPRTADALAATVAVCTEAGLPVTLRGGGTSLAGQAVGPGIVVDVSRHLDRVHAVDPDTRTATVEPGVVLSDLQAAATRHGLRYGPDPSTSNRAVVGGLLANDSCGPHSLRHGRTSDNVVAMEVALSDGTRASARWLDLADAVDVAGGTGRWATVVAGLIDLRDRISDEVAARLPTELPRLVSGMRLEALCAPDGLHLARLLVGTEGTCAVTTRATVRLVERPRATALVMLAFPDDVAAARQVPSLVDAGACAVEGLDATLVAGARRGRRPSPALDLLPDGRAWLVVETDGSTMAEAGRRARTILDDSGLPGVVVEEPDRQAEVWQVRTAGLGTITYEPGRAQTLPGWEDAAVPLGSLPEYLEGLHALLDRYGLRAGVYGHYGDGCVHTKIGFDHVTATGRATFAAFLDEAVDLVVGLGGSLSGEHGDGRARSAFLERMIGPELVAAMGEVRALLDPTGLLNPGVLVDPASPTDDLRAALPLARPATALAFADHGGFAGSADRCVGAGTCRRDDDLATMCPSYRATHDEQHSTRGRARLLAELLRADPTAPVDFDDAAVTEALGLCLSCKACAAECPVDVDMASLAAEVAHQRHDVLGVPRRPASLLLGNVRRLARLASLSPALANRVATSRPGRAAWHAAGLAVDRTPPPFAPTSFARSWQRAGVDHIGSGEPVTLKVDTFTDAFAPHVAVAAVRVLARTGHEVRVELAACCARPRFAEGQLEEARSELEDLVVRHDGTAGPVVWLEPSCLSVVRDELGELVDGPAATRLAERSTTLAELALAEDWALQPQSTAHVFHPHCHHAAVNGDDADRVVLGRLGPHRDLDAGCCGLAGGFAFGDDERSAIADAVADDRFAPRLRDTATDEVAVMDGFSCRTQVDHLGLDVRVRHLAEVLDDATRLPGLQPSLAPDADEQRGGS